MVYPLLFPSCEQGWHISIPHVEHQQTRIHNKVTMQEFYNYRLAIRAEFSALHKAVELLLQYIVDAYVKVEGCRLRSVQTNQSQLRVAMYAGLMDRHYLARNNPGGDPGVPVILR